MAHEITATDSIVLHKQAAWHKLGIIVEDAPTPAAALKLAKLNWNVEQWPITASNGEGKKIALSTQVANIRTDTLAHLGTVSPDYRPIQNNELADFCQLLAEQGDQVKVESAGSIRGGAKVWFLLKGESFSVRKKDEITPYILVSNGHDGGTALRCTPTTVRVVCSNTLHMVIPQKDRAGNVTKAKAASFVANHLGDVKEKIEAAKQALGLYGRSMDATREMIDAAAAREINSDKMKAFFIECYTRDFGAIAAEPKTAAEEKARSKSQAAFVQFETRFNAEKKLAGATAWNAFNAYTGWSQNDRTFWKDANQEADRRIASKLFGQDADRAIESLVAALAL